MMMTIHSPTWIKVLLLITPCWLAGCYHLDSKVDVLPQKTARPITPATPALATGSIYADSNSRPLFEDRRARFVGDTITVNLSERITSSQSTNTKTSKTSSMDTSIPLISKFWGKSFQGLGITADGSNKFEGTGQTGNNNLFNGTITTTVIEVLGNGNLIVSGEKQIGINGEVETLRFSGVVNPLNVLAGNIVSSTLIADARLEYYGRGALDDTQRMGWLQRFFNTFLPF
ncbi:flagellar basal body L-ring protein FlgH [Parvibium lacunae]|uniref:Flagellar L-ring protein n=1 Tax=Parvibium lacunae TaxID=1888893 RepID=A0A368L3U0_9BURK|nr:flagellar basal body L-ring protein FlgH [Parvibium lacunae]RCS58195.1 flagellar basal body L-ring protein FlgH [Parvibium lacunae]